DPQQHLFLHEHLAETGCGLGIGVGFLFDSLAGNVPRATSRVGLVYRLVQEPCRLARRYLVGNPLFLMRILQQWWSGARVRQAGPDSSRRATLPVEEAPTDRNRAAQEVVSA